MFWWYFWGVIMFLVTLFFHKHTYEVENGYVLTKGKRLPCPVWRVILSFIVFIVPIVNIVVFFLGAVAYLVTLCDGEMIMFELDPDTQPKWIRKIIMFMTKEV